MRALAACALLLALSTLPTAAFAMRSQGHHGVRVQVRHHHPNQFRTMHRAPLLGGVLGGGFYDGGGYYGSGAAPYAESTAPEPVVVPAPPPPRRIGDDRPTVEHTDVGVTIIRGPGLNH
jgi:hypothetical protein